MARSGEIVDGETSPVAEPAIVEEEQTILFTYIVKKEEEIYLLFINKILY